MLFLTFKFPHRPRFGDNPIKNTSTKRRSSAWNDLLDWEGVETLKVRQRLRSTLFLYIPRPMKLIEQNPFRILGIAVNASAKDLAANKGKMRLLDIGREVTFPLDLPGLLPSATRTKETVATAERDINLPQDKVKYALFWFAQPSDPLGKLAYYDHLLQGDVAKAQELFFKRSSWEAQLCLSVLELLQGQYCDALLDFYFLANEHCSELCNAVAGQTFSMDGNELVQLYLRTLATEVDASTLLQEWNNDNRVLPGGSEIIEFELRNMATDAPIKTIEKEIATAKAVDSKDAQAQLEAGKRLSNNTHKVRIQLQKLIGDSDPRYSRLVDKLANQILQCSINYFNNIEGENREIVENALKLGEYALKIAVGKMARDHIQHNVDILRKKKENLPPAEVDNEVNAILKALKEFVELPNKIEHSVALLDVTKPHFISMKAKLGEDNELYLQLSTQIVGNALSNVIAEVNDLSTTYSLSALPPTREQMKDVVSRAWRCIRKMQNYDMNKDFKNDKFRPNLRTLREMCWNLDCGFWWEVMGIVFIASVLAGFIIGSVNGEPGIGLAIGVGATLVIMAYSQHEVQFR